MKNKFTLLELLIVMAIIAILMSLLLPSIQKARKRAKGAVCQSNLKQLYVFSLMYAQKNNTKFVSNAHAPRVQDRGRWHYEFTKSGRTYELEHKEILACPVIHDVHVVQGLRTTGMNKYLIWKTARPNVHPKFTDISKPSHKILYGDGYGQDIPGGRKLFAGSLNNGSRLGELHDYIHFGKKNIIHVDGHVEAVTRSYLRSDTSLWTLD